MKIARLLLAATALLAAAACGRSTPTMPVDMDAEKPRDNIGTFGSGSISSDPPAPRDPSLSLSSSVAD